MGKRDFQNEILDAYLEKHSTKEPILLKELNQATQNHFKDAHMLSGHTQGRFLSLISKMHRPQHILEIGTYTGYATLCLAEGLKENGRITTIDINAELKDFYTPFFEKTGIHHQINPIIDDAVTYLQNTDDVYDLVFLDANKRKYITYFDLIIPKLNPGGIILADNILWKGKVLEKFDVKDKMTKSLDEFNKYVANNDSVEVVLLPLRDGISLIRKK